MSDADGAVSASQQAVSCAAAQSNEQAAAPPVSVPGVETDVKTADPPAADAPKTPTIPAESSDQSVAVNGGPDKEDEELFVKHLVENRAAFKRLKEEIEGDIERIDRDIAAHKKARAAAKVAAEVAQKQQQ